MIRTLAASEEMLSCSKGRLLEQINSVNTDEEELDIHVLKNIPLNPNCDLDVLQELFSRTKLIKNYLIFDVYLNMLENTSLSFAVNKSIYSLHMVPEYRFLLSKKFRFPGVKNVLLTNKNFSLCLRNNYFLSSFLIKLL